MLNKTAAPRIFSVLLCALSVGAAGLSVSLSTSSAIAATTTSDWSNDANYALGDLVSYEGNVYRCIIAHHSAPGWDPASVPALWERVAPEGEVAWHAQTAYKSGDVVEYNDKVYECLQAHTSQPGWTPAAVPALWKFLGNAS
jgi:chitodextrinase